MLYQIITRIQLVAPWFLQSFWPTTHTHAAVWLLKSRSSRAVGGMVQEKGSRGRRSSRTVLHAQCMCTSALYSWKKKSHLWRAWWCV